VKSPREEVFAKREATGLHKSLEAVIVIVDTIRGTKFTLITLLVGQTAAAHQSSTLMVAFAGKEWIYLHRRHSYCEPKLIVTPGGHSGDGKLQ
jgi:hypothetical protein